MRLSNEQILKKAIEKAKKNGYMHIFLLTLKATKINKYHYAFIFSHDFAKAFWDEEELVDGKGLKIGKRWQYHLQQMVLEEEPLKYLEKFL